MYLFSKLPAIWKIPFLFPIILNFWNSSMVRRNRMSSLSRHSMLRVLQGKIFSRSPAASPQGPNNQHDNSGSYSPQSQDRKTLGNKLHHALASKWKQQEAHLPSLGGRHTSPQVPTGRHLVTKSHWHQTRLSFSHMQTSHTQWLDSKCLSAVPATVLCSLFLFVLP